MGRHYYNSNAGETIPQHKWVSLISTRPYSVMYFFYLFLIIPFLIVIRRLELWPGFITSILQYERSVMLCADISHKILRMDTVLDLFYDLQKKGRNVMDECYRSIVGEIVLTR